MPTKKDDEGSGAANPQAWDEDSVTDVGMLISDALRKLGKSGGLPVVHDEAEDPGQERTGRYPPASSRSASMGAALPKFLAAHLDVLSGPDAGACHQLTMVRTLIGRGRQADVRVQDKRVSRQHVSITYTETEFRIRNERSSNGTFLNGSMVVEYALRDGDKLLIGDTLLRFRVARVGHI